MKKGIYIKLPSGWIRVKTRIGYEIGDVVKRMRYRRVPILGLIGEGVEEEPIGDKIVGRLYISAYRITKYITRVLDERVSGLVIIKPITKETYELTLYDSTKNYLKKLEKIAEELNALKKKPIKTT